MALARLQTGRNAELTALLNSLQIGGDGRTVSLAFAVPAEMLEAFVALHRQRRPDAPASPEPPAPNTQIF
jgi:hypothetical protein